MITVAVVGIRFPCILQHSKEWQMMNWLSPSAVLEGVWLHLCARYLVEGSDVYDINSVDLQKLTGCRLKSVIPVDIHLHCMCRCIVMDIYCVLMEGLAKVRMFSQLCIYV